MGHDGLKPSDPCKTFPKHKTDCLCLWPLTGEILLNQLH